MDLMEETPAFKPACVEGAPYLKVEGNIHQAMWVLTRSQVNLLQHKCSFLNQSSPSREYMSSFSLFTPKGGHCRLNKLLPGTRLQTFSVNHYYHQRHTSNSEVFGLDEYLQTDYDTRTAVGGCWEGVVDKKRSELGLDSLAVKNSTTTGVKV
eukprot:gene33221-40991_t